MCGLNYQNSAFYPIAFLAGQDIICRKIGIEPQIIVKVQLKYLWGFVSFFTEELCMCHFMYKWIYSMLVAFLVFTIG